MLGTVYHGFEEIFTGKRLFCCGTGGIPLGERMVKTWETKGRWIASGLVFCRNCSLGRGKTWDFELPIPFISTITKVSKVEYIPPD